MLYTLAKPGKDHMVDTSKDPELPGNAPIKNPEAVSSGTG